VRGALAAATLAAFLAAAPARAVERPLWEVGVGGLGLYLPNYRGSDLSQGYLYPLPFFAYRGDWFRVDREGIRGIFFQSDRVELDVSMYATPPIRNNSEGARAGMPELDATVEVGPVVDILLARDRKIDYNYRLRLRLAARAVFAFDISPQHWQNQGWIFYPNLNLDVRPEFLGGRWNVGFSAGPLFGTQKYHQYFYGVPEQFATPERPAYNAPGGYSGLTVLASISRRFEKFWVGAYVRYDNLSGAVFDPSPLVQQNYALGGGIAIAWVFAESGTKVQTPD
jgi:outer membrane scaffolding protein for murein synthesis (MipA/OmpV family)